jgi:hypothetical protein
MFWRINRGGIQSIYNVLYIVDHGQNGWNISGPGARCNDNLEMWFNCYFGWKNPVWSRMEIFTKKARPHI